MKLFCSIAAAGALLISAQTMSPAMAQQITGGGSTNIWSSAQGTAFTYGTANGFGNSTSGSMATAGGQGLNASASFGGGAITSAITMSTAGASSNGGGYAQAQTSGYAGGSVSGFGTRTH
jgi:hypothetical protein